MSEPQGDDMEDLLRRMEREFGPRRPREGEADPPPPPLPPQRRPGPIGGTPPMPSIIQAPQRRPAARRPAAVWVLLWAIALIYLASGLLSGSLFQPTLDVLIALGAKENRLIADGQLWRLLTATFLHGNLIHIFLNGYALYSLGPESERIYGTRRFLALYLVAGLGGSVASYAISPAPSVGASGSIFGLIGGLGVFYYLNRQALGEFGRMQVQSMVAVAMLNLFIGFANPGMIDNWGHLGGLIGGALAGLALAPRLAIDERFLPPLLTRRFVAWGWYGTLGLALIIAALAILLPGAR